MSRLSVSASGVCAYRIVRMPARASIASRAASRSRLVLWLLSSSSITAMTSKAGVQTTKSAIFWLNLFLAAWDRAVSRAPSDTCARMMCSGSEQRRRWYIACSRFVRGTRRLAASSARRGVFFARKARAAAMTKAISRIARFILEAKRRFDDRHGLPAACCRLPRRSRAVNPARRHAAARSRWRFWCCMGSMSWFPGRAERRAVRAGCPCIGVRRTPVAGGS